MNTDLSSAEPRPSWSESSRRIPRVVVRPAMRFMNTEAAGGMVMLAAGVLALVWANSPWYRAYETLWSTPVDLRVGSAIELTGLDLHALVNDALMTLFFLLAGLEIKRQLVKGELRDPRAAALPALAALGGMLVPALFYLAFNAGHPGAHGWGVPVATDIAFAVGVVTLVGNRVPIGARIFLLTLAVVDDIGGILVIALFYAKDVQFGWLGVAALAIAFAVLAGRNDIRSSVPYIVCGVVCWYALHHAGVESAITGVIFGLLTPTEPVHGSDTLGRRLRDFVGQIERGEEPHVVHHVQKVALHAVSPLERIEQKLGLWVAFLIVPLFAFANAGVHLGGEDLDLRIVLGVGVGLVLGKTIGVFVASFLAVRSGLGILPAGTTWRHVFGLAVTAGIGFTVALFVATLSFDDVAQTASAKVGILSASVIAGVLGYLLLRAVPVRSGADDA